MTEQEYRFTAVNRRNGLKLIHIVQAKTRDAAWKSLEMFLEINGYMTSDWDFESVVVK